MSLCNMGELVLIESVVAYFMKVVMTSMLVERLF